MRKRRKQDAREIRRLEGPGAVGLLEEAIHLLRTAPPGTLTQYYIGAIPFMVALLFFWTDMAQSPFAQEKLGWSALVMTFWFLWMRAWDAVFARGLLSSLRGDEPVKLSLRSFCRLGFQQAAIHGAGIWAVPVAAVVLAPFGWVFAFFNSATVLADPEAKVGELSRRAWKQAKLWPGQNHIGFLAIKLLALMMFLNLCIALYFIPQLIKSFFGIDTGFTTLGLGAINSTFFMVAAVLTWLCVAPLSRAFYALRCFYGEAVATGEDLRAELRRLSTKAIVVGVLVMACCAPGEVRASDADDLEEAIEETLRQPEYSWTYPIDRSASSDNWFRAMFTSLGESLETAFDAIGRWVEALFKDDPTQKSSWFRDWLRKIFGGSDGIMGGGGGIGILLWTLTFILLISAIVLLARWLLKRFRQSEDTAETPGPPVAIDLTQEDVSAEEAAEDEWRAMARDYLNKGETRLALRAMYLATLAHLGERGFVRLGRAKSNAEYQFELRRRTKREPRFSEWFADTVGIFERVWYGSHAATQNYFERLCSNDERIRQCET